MDAQSGTSSHSDAFHVLGLQPGAGEDDVRARYLKLVRENPPERNAEKFRQIHEAYLAASDPLVIARRLLERPDDEPRSWSEIIEEQKNQPPRLHVNTLLSLGNRSEDLQ